MFYMVSLFRSCIICASLTLRRHLTGSQRRFGVGNEEERYTRGNMVVSLYAFESKGLKVNLGKTKLVESEAECEVSLSKVDP